MEEAEPRDRFEPRELFGSDVLAAFTNAELSSTVCYICGPPQMTDHTVNLLRDKIGLDGGHILYRKLERLDDVSSVHTEEASKYIFR